MVEVYFLCVHAFHIYNFCVRLRITLQKINRKIRTQMETENDKGLHGGNLWNKAVKAQTYHGRCHVKSERHELIDGKMTIGLSHGTELQQ